MRRNWRRRTGIRKEEQEEEGGGIEEQRRRRQAGKWGGGEREGRGRVVASTSPHSAGKNVEKLEHLYIACGNGKCCSCYEKQFGCSSKC